ncbi:MAG TPA: ATP-grasp domain-containing protein, partial [Syntrophales bacterium]|nr:ATP-grasp domain-containing protein [Syntrophales bacterium]
MKTKKVTPMTLVGMTYDLRTDYIREGYSEEETAEFDQPATIDAIEETLQSLGYRTDRIGHVRALARRLVAGERWDLVFNIAEGLKGFGREAQVPCLLDAYGVPYVFSDPLSLSLTLHKAMAKRVVRDLGILTPDFAVVEDADDIAAVVLPFPLFVKPVSEGTGKGIDGRSIVRDRAELDRQCRSLLASFAQPVLVETYLSGREFTVGVVGTGRRARVIAVMEVLLRESAEKGVYSLFNKEYCEEHVRYTLVKGAEAEQVSAVALAAWRGLECRDGGRLDIRADAAGRPHFLEVNPLAGLHPTHSDLPILSTLAGISYRDLLRMIMTSAEERL